MNLSIKSEYENLINSLIKDGYLKTPEIIEAFRMIDRADFVLEEYKSEAYVNAPLSIGFNQTISQPLTVAFMLELLQPKAGEKIIDIGAGSGWVSALLAHIVGVQGKIIAIERIPELKEMAEKNISKYGFLISYRNEVSGAWVENGIVELVLGDGSKGYKPSSRTSSPLGKKEIFLYDKIIAAAAAKGELPKEWQKQLKIGGRIVSPLENSIVVIDKIEKNKYNVKEHFGFSFVPLITS